MCNGTVNGREHEGYVPGDLGIGGGDYLEFSYCLDCGQLQGNYPLPISAIEKDLDDSTIMDFFLRHGLKPFGEKDSQSFWRMVDEATVMNKLFGDFIRIFFQTQVVGFTNKVACYKSPFDSWETLFMGYKNSVRK